MDYFSEIYDGQVTNRTLELIEADEHGEHMERVFQKIWKFLISTIWN